MSTRLLREFIRVVPTCANTTSLSALLELVEASDCDEVIVVEGQQPAGVVRSSKLFAWAVSQSNQRSSFTRSPLLANPDLVEPLICLAADQPTQHCLTYLTDTNHPPILAIVDAENNLLGVLNHLALLKATLSETDRLPRDRPHPALIRSDSLPLSLVQSLLQLLEQLPLPAMLQTSQGQVILQNSTWQQQIGELQNPESIRQEAGLLLELGALYQSSHALYPESGLPTNTALGICEIGTAPNTCVCTCSMKNGPERTWQFTRIPLHFPAAVVQASPSPPTAPFCSDPKFHLAALDAVSTPNPSIPPRLLQPDAPLPTALSEELSDDLWLVLAQDHTEQQQVARELVAKNADLMQVNRFKDEFLSCISHELRTPLTAVLGLSSLLGEQTLGNLNERQTRYVRLIHQSGRHLMTIVNDILDLTRIETGQLNLDLAPTEIPLVCDRAYQQFLRAQEELPNFVQGPGFTLEIESQVTHLIADEARLRQILINLISNAYKFTGPDGQIGLRVNRWEGWVAFTVWDTGIGIPADKQHLIFQKFQQLENPLTRRFEGTGLGLVLAQRLARLHGGDITFFSKEGEGSQFTLLLPPCPPNYQPLTPEDEFALTSPLTYSHPTPDSRLVLIIESVPRLIEDLYQQLTGMAYRVAIARCGTEALEKARRLQPCLIFLNPVLPTLSGWDVLTLLKSTPETRQIPLVVTATAVEQEQATRYRADGFLVLPIQLPALAQSLAHLTQTPDPAPPSQPPMTILWIRTQGDSPPVLATEPLQADISSLLQAHHHRILEVDDLDQAELLARVWRPQMVLLDVAPPDPGHYVQELRQHSFLASLPLITLNHSITQAANQIPGLLVFPCLVSPGTKLATPDGQPEVSALLQVIQVAAGMNWKPCILVTDLGMISSSMEFADAEADYPHPRSQTTPIFFSQPDSYLGQTEPNSLQQLHWQSQVDWLQSWSQYLQTADFHSVVGYSWGEVLRQIQYQTVDLLLICLRDPPLHPEMVQDIQAGQQKALQVLQKLAHKPPTLLLNYQLQRQVELEQSLGAIAAQYPQATPTQVLPASLSMQDLVQHIRTTLEPTFQPRNDP